MRAKNNFRFTLLDLFVFFFAGSVFLSSFVFNHVSANSNKLFLFALLNVLYFYARLVFDVKKQNRFLLLCFFIVITGLIEAIWGMMQLYGFKSSQHTLFKLTGSFFNPGPYAGYLAVVFPIALHLFFKGYNDYITFIRICLCGLTCVAILMVLPASMSRASWLAIVAGSLVVIVNKWKVNIIVLKKKKLKIFTLCLLFCLLVAAFWGTYYLKKDSADGRLLTWKVSISTLAQHPLGVGLGHFPSAYGETQAAYFASGKAFLKEEYVAGNPEYAYNEFLQISIESGIVSLLLFVGILICAMRGLIKSENWGVLGSLVALLVFACFSYPFSVLPFLIVFVFLLAMSVTEKSTQISQNRKIIHSISISFVLVVCTIVTTFCLWKQYPVYNAYKQWKSHQSYYRMEMYKEASQSYESLFPYLNDQIQFLFEYGRSLSMSEQPEKSNEVLKYAMQISCDPMLYNIMGKNYQAMKQYEEAERCFIKASNIVPNRIYPYYLKALMYLEAGETEKAKVAAQIVLTKEPKVQSTAVKEMREEARKIMIND